MTLLSIIIYTMGFITLAWAAFGLFLFMFFTPVYVSSGAPFRAKVGITFVSCFVLPYLLFTIGKLPSALITNQNMDAEEEEKVKQFLAKTRNCDCPACRARRGE